MVFGEFRHNKKKSIGENKPFFSWSTVFWTCKETRAISSCLVQIEVARQGQSEQGVIKSYCKGVILPII